MNRITAMISIAAAFAAGCGATYSMQPASAANELTAQIINVPELIGDALGPAEGPAKASKSACKSSGSSGKASKSACLRTS